jgi:hypothetical protein
LLLLLLLLLAAAATAAVAILKSSLQSQFYVLGIVKYLRPRYAYSSQRVSQRKALAASKEVAGT